MLCCICLFRPSLWAWKGSSELILIIKINTCSWYRYQLSKENKAILTSICWYFANTLSSSPWRNNLHGHDDLVQVCCIMARCGRKLIDRRSVRATYPLQYLNCIIVQLSLISQSIHNTKEKFPNHLFFFFKF